MRPIDADRMIDVAFEVATKFVGERSHSGKFIAQAVYQAVVAAVQESPTLTEDEWNEWRGKWVDIG